MSEEPDARPWQSACISTVLAELPEKVRKAIPAEVKEKLARLVTPPAGKTVEALERIYNRAFIEVSLGGARETDRLWLLALSDIRDMANAALRVRDEHALREDRDSGLRGASPASPSDAQTIPSREGRR